MLDLKGKKLSELTNKEIVEIFKNQLNMNISLEEAKGYKELNGKFGNIFNRKFPDIDFMDLIKQNKDIYLDFRPLEDMEEDKRLALESKILKSVKESNKIKILRSKVNINALDDETQEILSRAMTVVSLPSNIETEKIGKASLKIIKKALENNESKTLEKDTHIFLPSEQL